MWKKIAFICLLKERSIHFLRKGAVQINKLAFFCYFIGGEGMRFMQEIIHKVNFHP